MVEHGSDDYKQTVELRRRILRTPLGLDFTWEELASEAEDIHLAAFRDGVLVACLVLTLVGDETVKMRQVAVDSELQGTGIGSELVRRSEVVARDDGFSEMVLHARDTAVPFYLRLGYEVVGEPFEEVSIPHLAMRKSLVVRPPTS